MKKLKYEILFIILFMSVGIAAVSSNLLINGATQIASNSDDFFVYFSDVLVNGERDLSLAKNETSIVFSRDFSTIGEKIEITYDVTNASKNYDADISITCTPSNEYLTINNSFDSDSLLSARSTRSGVLTIVLSKSYVGADLTQDISCTIDASASERTNQGSSDVLRPLSQYAIGREVTIGTEKFNIIKEEEDTITMLAQYNVDMNTSRQTYNNSMWTFSSDSGWEYTPGPKEIDVQIWSEDPKTILNDYVSFLQESLGDDSITGDLITLMDLKELGCSSISDYYAPSEYENCLSSPYVDWLINGQKWWTKSAVSTYSYYIWIVTSDGKLRLELNYYPSSVRPVITIPKTTLEKIN